MIRNPLVSGVDFEGVSFFTQFILHHMMIKAFLDILQQMNKYYTECEYHWQIEAELAWAIYSHSQSPCHLEPGDERSISFSN